MRAVSAIASAIMDGSEENIYQIKPGTAIEIPYRILSKLKGCIIRKMIREYHLTTDDEIDDALKNGRPAKIVINRYFLNAYDNLGT